MHLNDKKLYENLGADTTLNYAKVKRKIDDMLQRNTQQNRNAAF